MAAEAVDEDDAGARGLGAADGHGKVVAIVVALFIGRRGIVHAHDDRPGGLDVGRINFVEPFGFEVDAFGGGKIEQVHAGEFAFAEHEAIIFDDRERETGGPGEIDVQMSNAKNIFDLRFEIFNLRCRRRGI